MLVLTFRQEECGDIQRVRKKRTPLNGSTKDERLDDVTRYRRTIHFVICFLLRKFLVYLQGGKRVDMRPEVVVLDVSDVDRVKAFYQNLGRRCSRKSPPTSPILCNRR